MLQKWDKMPEIENNIPPLWGFGLFATVFYNHIIPTGFLGSPVDQNKCRKQVRASWEKAVGVI